jgi:AmmeMemoRadiSam system protein B/AmmeMemoRadiSam system protein A
MDRIRPAAVAGTFYPRDARELRAEIDELLDGIGQPEPRFGHPKALVVPHAGYIYSGPVAAAAYDTLAAARGVVTRVVLLGPVHRVPVRGLALPAADVFDTPLGRIRIDRAAADSLADLPQVVRSDPAHAMEHSLEVQLPFLQRMLGDFALVPLAVGNASVDEVAQVIERLWGGSDTLIVISTDLSHYHPYEDARRIDARTLARIASCATDLDHEEACGATPLNGMLQIARTRGLSIRQLAANNSGDTAGGRGQVVGYSAFTLEEPGSAISHADAGRTLIALARAAIAGELGIETPRAAEYGAWLRQAGATFVTLMKEGRLRGCIGSLQAVRPLAEDAAANAIGAAFRDPRFPRLTAEEWPHSTVEVSLLSAPKTIRFAEEADLLAQIVPGVDGLIVEYEGRRATYLPQVWETLPDKQRFLAELKQKAGIAAEIPLRRCKVRRYRVVKWKEERRH